MNQGTSEDDQSESQPDSRPDPGPEPSGGPRRPTMLRRISEAMVLAACAGAAGTLASRLVTEAWGYLGQH
ncbi:hypothetical protein ACIGZJ_18515 [Kitasatospora sp. NPDC052868]|uniref:hypothetical protein n=1 Tax=Kitasatospora sp. NPDC052868 TaxID=3364060 RepID=UPI0037C773DD